MSEPAVSFLISFGLHAALLFGTAGIFVQPPKYDVEAGSGGVEVSLIAAPLPATGPETQPASGNVPVIPAEAGIREELDPRFREDDIIQGERSPAPAAAAEHQPEKSSGLKTAHSSPYVGDGSSPVPGRDPTTFYLPGGASGTGGRLKNPAPAYPYAAIRQGQQGLVMLEVLVDKTGRPTSVKIHQSSGFALLDQSALWTVRRWKFDPAHVGFIPTNARIRVPIRFMLDKKE